MSSASEPRAQNLMSYRNDELHETRVQLRAEVKSGNVELKVGFDPKFDGVSLPYNLYAVLILRNGQTEQWLDFTNGCKGPGLGFFPGREIRLPTVKSIGESPEQLQIMVWGRM